MEILRYEFMQQAFLAALLIGACAPAVGCYLVQRRMAMIGEGLGHIALTGVAIGLLTGKAPVWTALVVAIVGAVLMEWLRSTGRTGSDAVIAILLYGGIAGAVVLAWGGSGRNGQLGTYLFGSIATTTRTDVTIFAILSAVVLAITIGLARPLFAVGYDEQWARAAGLPVRGLNLLLAVLTAVTVVVSMRVVGLLLIGALLAVPVTTAYLLTGRFRVAMLLGVGIGLVAAVGGLTASYYADAPSGGTIVLLAIGLYAAVTIGRSVTDAVRTHRQAHRLTVVGGGQ